jgi:hypothetical protein
MLPFAFRNWQITSKARLIICKAPLTEINLSDVGRGWNEHWGVCITDIKLGNNKNNKVKNEMKCFS